MISNLSPIESLAQHAADTTPRQMGEWHYPLDH